MSVIDRPFAPRSSRIDRCACTASSECPPRSKKLSRPEMSCTPRTALQIPAICACSRAEPCAVTGAAAAALGAARGGARRASGAGSALRSTFLLGVSGKASTRIRCAGTMKAGSAAPMADFSAASLTGSGAV